MKTKEYITSDYYEAAAIETLAGVVFDEEHILNHGGREQVVVVYKGHDDIPERKDIKLVWEVDGEIKAKCDLLPCGGLCFENTHVMRKNEMLDKLHRKERK